MNAGEGYRIPFRKSTDQELVQWLLRKVDAEQIEWNVFSSQFVERLYFNAAHAITNRVPGLKPEEYENDPAFLTYYLDCVENYRMQYL